MRQIDYLRVKATKVCHDPKLSITQSLTHRHQAKEQNYRKREREKEGEGERRRDGLIHLAKQNVKYFNYFYFVGVREGTCSIRFPGSKQLCQ